MCIRDRNISDPTNLSPLTFDSVHKTFTFFTENPDLLGEHEYVVWGSLEEYPNTPNFGSDITAYASNAIKVVTACTGLESVSTAQGHHE